MCQKTVLQPKHVADVINRRYPSREVHSIMVPGCVCVSHNVSASVCLAQSNELNAQAKRGSLFDSDNLFACEVLNMTSICVLSLSSSALCTYLSTLHSFS